jgi:hypothetical protein
MTDDRDPTTAIAVAAGQASMLLGAGALPAELAGAKVERRGTPVHDLNGTVLFRRCALRNRQTAGYLDVGSDPAIGAPLVAVAPAADWSPRSLLEEATAALRKGAGRRAKFDEARFVAYSFPKLAVQFLLEGQEVALLELHTWEPVPPARYRDKDEPPADFDRWSYLDEMPTKVRATRVRRYEQATNELLEVLSRFDRDRYAIVAVNVLDLLRRTTTRELHYSTRNADHQVCYELRGQQTSVWCVGASVQMVLDFYRYEYTQVRLAQELGLGTLANPNGLPYANDSLVVTVLEDLSSGALDATMFTTNPFSRFRTEINANRPLVSFIPGHSRTVAGYTETTWLILAAAGFRGLCVYDPWPPNAGVITRWENFDTQTYRRTFTAQVTLA